MDEQDYYLIRVWLKGYIKESRNGLERHTYLETEYEDKARALLADLLRSKRPVPIIIREALADLIDPTPELEPRKFKIIFRKSGRPVDNYHRSSIARYILRQIQEGVKVDCAVHSAMQRFNMSRRQALEIWQLYKPLFVATGQLEIRNRRPKL